MNNLKQAAEQALRALEATSSYDIPPTSQVRSAINALRAALEQAEPNRRALQAAGTHPAPCARHCEAKAFEIEIRSLKSQLKQQAEPVGWQPIETAPKDKQDRLLYKQGIISQAKWLGEGKGFGGDHWSYDMPQNIANGFDNQPSHWMPLPQPPIEAAHGIKEMK